MKKNLSIAFFIGLIIILVGIIFWESIYITGLAKRFSQEKKDKENVLRQFSELKNNFNLLKEDVSKLRKVLLIERTLNNSEKISEKKDPSIASPYQLIWPKQSNFNSQAKDYNLNQKQENNQYSLSKIRDYIKEKEKENAILKESLERLNNLLQTKEAQISRLEEEGLSLKKQLDAFSQEKIELQKSFEDKIGNLKIEWDKDKELLKEKEKENFDLKSRLDNLSTKFLDAGLKLETQVKLIDNLQAELQSAKKESEQLKRQKDEAFLALQEKQKTLEVASGENLDKEIKIRDYQMKLSELNEQKISLEKESLSLKEKIKSLEEKINNLNETQGKFLEINTKLANTENIIKQLNQENEAVKQERDNFKQEKDALKEEIAKLKKTIKEKEKMGAQFNQQKAALLADDELIAKLQKGNLHYKQMESIIAKMRAMIDMLKAKEIEVAKLKEEIKQLKLALDKKEYLVNNMKETNQKIYTSCNELSEILKDLELLTWDEAIDKNELRKTVKKIEIILKEITDYLSQGSFKNENLE